MNLLTKIVLGNKQRKTSSLSVRQIDILCQVIRICFSYLKTGDETASFNLFFMYFKFGIV